MNRSILAAAVLLFAAPLAAQSTTQDEIEARYDRALAAGYKALFLCSAIANAEANGVTRTVESVEQWELNGIQSPLDEVIGELSVNFVWSVDSADPSIRTLRHVGVPYQIGPPRIANYTEGEGCSLMPIHSILPDAEDDFDFTRDIPEGRPAIQSRALPVSGKAEDARLGGLAQGAFGDAYGEGTRTTAVVVADNQNIVFSRYLEPFTPNVPQRTWSVAKSIAATLVGASIYRGEIDWRDTARLGQGKPDRRGEIIIDNLLRMASGRYSNTAGNRTDSLYFGGSTVEETALHWPMVSEPNSVFRYANNDTLAATEAIEWTFDKHPPAQFFAQLGMPHTVAETDWQGSYILSSQVWSTAPDLARLGQLYLNNGVLPDGERILPEDWVGYVSKPSGPQPGGAFGYGAGFWLFNKSEGIPTDTFAAMGNRGQFIVIVPSLNVVIVRRGEDPTGSRFDIAGFTRDVLESLGK